jgi:hypothetical protein
MCKPQTLTSNLEVELIVLANHAVANTRGGGGLMIGRESEPLSLKSEYASRREILPDRLMII